MATFWNKMSDAELLTRLTDEDHAVFAEIYGRYRAVLFAHAYKIIQDEDVAKDVVQELFTNIWMRRQDLQIRTTLSAYLYTSVRNRVLDYISHQNVEDRYLNSLSDFIEKGEWVTDEQMREKELSELIDKEIALLPTKMRQVFELSRFQEYSYNEIATELDISDKTVKKQVHNALQILRKKLDFALFFGFL